jgi:hypothetical protein
MHEGKHVNIYSYSIERSLGCSTKEGQKVVNMVIQHFCLALGLAI